MNQSLKSNLCIVWEKIHLLTPNMSLQERVEMKIESPIRCIRTFFWFQKRSWMSLIGKEAIMGMEDGIIYPRKVKCLGVHITKFPFSETEIVKTQ